jgi:amino acid transporter
MAKKLKKELSLIDVICISSGVMISSGLFILPAIAYTKAGASMVLSYIIGSLLIIPTVLSKSELVTAIPITGGIYVFADRSMGPMVGTLAGLTAWISLAFKSAFSLLAMGIFVLLLKPDISMLQIKLIAAACCVFFTIINIRGVKLSGRFQTISVIVLIALLVIYSAIGSFSVQAERYIPFAPMGIGPIFATAGLIFISFSGTTKITAIAGEVKNPARNLPLAIFYSWGIVSILYAVVVFVTIGLLEPAELADTFTPITVGGGKIMGQFGALLMTMAALLAFISTGNAGLLAASRNPFAMGKDELLPGFFSKISGRGAPSIAIICTSAIMIAVIFFLDIETFIKTASSLKLILFIIANLALIFMREANIHHYRPKYKAPFYRWAQIIGILSYGFLLTQMGRVPLMIVTVFILCGIGWYFLYARGKIKREYAILHIIERVTGIKSTDQLL